MSLIIQEIECKSALTGQGGHYRLNPYGGCEHACAYCYASYLGRWRGQSGPWGSWVQVKTNVARVLEKELTRRTGIEIFMSTACDVYQPVERKYKLTRACLSVLALAAQRDEALRVFLLTKSDLILRDLDVLRSFPPQSLSVAFSLAMLDDKTSAVLEPHASPPSRRLAAAQELAAAGLRVGVMVNPVLPHVTERDLAALLDRIEQAGCQSVSFDMLNYLDRHIAGKMREAYAQLGSQALARLEQARTDPGYEASVQVQIEREMKGRGLSWSRR
jgi:DNA repair photolyase